MFVGGPGISVVVLLKACALNRPAAGLPSFRMKMGSLLTGPMMTEVGSVGVLSRTWNLRAVKTALLSRGLMVAMATAVAVGRPKVRKNSAVCLVMMPMGFRLSWIRNLPMLGAAGLLSASNLFAGPMGPIDIEMCGPPFVISVLLSAC